MDYDSDMPRKITEVLVRKVPDNQQVSTDPSQWQVVHWPGNQGVSRLLFGPRGVSLPLTQPPM